ncbi:MAG: aminotransferase class V-fold PLP-dependent enzyme [Muribaculaceae bacterium]|nr:aminotransferase class V-fold PLP-dependent enzyme [Muribaculaceae bacterium]MDE6094255.1 aminotransferase class V-fold PLP-dependent enzyme [Muribaculaceae bacterium]
MIYFDSDYMVGAHPEVLERLVETNGLHTVGYGRDEFTAEAKRVVLDACGIADGEVYFLEGGTQTNAVVIDRLLDHNDGVVAVDTAHINVHEAGAIESTGHKIITLPNRDGKLDAKALDSYIDGFYRDETNHYMVRPGMVYISYPTELGTVYSRQELADIGDVCRRWNIPLYVDGARLAYGLCADGAEVGLKDLAGMCDVFYIGGTKCGALFGEAVVTRHRDLLPRFVSLIKLHGATLAKGRLLGVQFTALFSNGLYERIGAHAVRLAMKLKAGFTEKGYRLYIDSPTNQQFFVLPNEKIDELKKVASFELWGPRGETETPVRFVTDWATTDADVDTLTAAL